MAKKKEKKGFTPELHELFDTLYAKLREYGQCCAFIAICDNKNEITKRIRIIDEVTYKEDKEIVTPDLAIVNAMGEQVIIFTVEADSFNDICEFNDMILEVQGYLASYDVTPFIHLQS